MHKELSPGLAHSRCSSGGVKLIACSEAGRLCRESSPRIPSPVLGSGRQRKASASGVSEVRGGIAPRSPYHCPIPTRSSSSAPAPDTPTPRWKQEQPRHQKEGGKSPQPGRRSLLSQSGPAGRGGGCGARTSDAISSQGTIKVAELPGGPGCLQRSLRPRRLLPPAWAARPGYAPLGGCRPVSRTPLSGSLLLNSISPSVFSVLPSPVFSPVFLSPSLCFCLSHALSLSLLTVSHPRLIFPPSNVLHPCSLYLFFFPDAFLVSLIFFLSASLFLFLSSSAIWFFLCLTLNLKNAAPQRREGPAA